MQIPIKVWFFKFNSSVKLDDQFEKNPTVVLMPLINNLPCIIVKPINQRVDESLHAEIITQIS